MRRTATGWDLPRRASWRGAVPAVSFLDHVSRRLAEAPDRVCVIDGGQRITRRELFDNALRLGAALWRRGLRPGSVVSFQLPNWHEACVINLACSLYGFVANPLLPMYRERDLAFILDRCRSDALFLPGTFRNVDYQALLAEVDYPTRRADRIFGVRSTASGGSYDDLVAEQGEPVQPPQVDPQSVRLVIFTSGSTARPKGVLHSHETITTLVQRAGEFWGVGEGDTLFVPSPLAHIGGSLYAFEFPWIAGSTALLMESWNAGAAVEMIDREGANFCAGATPFLQGLLDAATERGTGLPSLRRFICGGASVPVSLIERASERFSKAVVSRAYGSSEVPLVCPGIRSRADQRHGAMTDGEVMAEIRLTDAEGQPVAPGGSGHIRARWPGMFIGYLDPQDETGQFDKDGFFAMGDIGRVVDGRYLEITGRAKDIIIRNGENISPREIENILLDHEAVAQVAVVGIPDERTGERAVACVVTKPGRTLALGDMQQALAGAGLARQKIPERLDILPSLPMNAIGKILKEELKRQLLAAGGPAEAAGGERRP